jgi:hypothetical protein
MIWISLFGLLTSFRTNFAISLLLTAVSVAPGFSMKCVIDHPARILISLGLITGLFSFEESTVAAKTVALRTLPSLTSVTETSSGDDITLFMTIPPTSMDQQLSVTINVCSLSSSHQYPRVLITNATELFPTLGSYVELFPTQNQSGISLSSGKKDKSGYSDPDRANLIAEVRRGQYVWSVNLEGNSGFANWTGWMGDGGMIGFLADDQVGLLDVEVGVRLGGER